MVVSYRLKKKELIFLLDFFGDVNTLGQSFGAVYIDENEHRKIAKDLHRKGLVTFMKNEVTVERGIECIIKKMYDAQIIFADSGYSLWVYCCKEFIVILRLSERISDEFLVTPLRNKDELYECFDEFGLNEFVFEKNTDRGCSIEEVREILAEYSYE